MSLDGLPAGHLRVLLDGLSIFEQHGLLLAGGYAFRAHEILYRRRHEPDLDLGTVLDHLAGVSVFPDEDFTEYGLDISAIVSLRAWATGWYDDLARRLASEDMDGETLGDP